MDWIAVGSLIGTLFGVMIAYRALQRSIGESHRQQSEREQRREQDRTERETRFMIENEKRHTAHEGNFKLVQQEVHGLASRIDERLATMNRQLDATNHHLIQTNELLREVLVKQGR